MSQPDRKAVYQALMTLLTNALGPNGSKAFVTMGRKLLLVNDCQPANAPYLFQNQKNEQVQASKGVPGIRKFGVDLFLYANYGGDVDAIPTDTMDDLVTAVEAALGPNVATAFQQLGVPVSSCLVNGTIEYFEGVLQQWTIAIIPVEIIANY